MAWRALLCLLLALVDGAAGQLVDYKSQIGLEEASFFPKSYPFPQYLAVDLTADNFMLMMADSNRKFFAIAFYSEWSPHCQAFAPRLERTAMAYNDAETDVWVGRVDCSV